MCNNRYYLSRHPHTHMFRARDNKAKGKYRITLRDSNSINIPISNHPSNAVLLRHAIISITYLQPPYSLF